LGNLDTGDTPWGGGSLAGDILITAGGDITLSGSITANNTYADSEDGVLSLTATGAAARITVKDLDCATFRMSAGYWTFNAGGGKSYITGVLANFDTTNSPAAELRVPAGQILYYDPKVPGNQYLARKRYTLSGGGILRPPVSGTVVSYK
jgi:hypothetical protein